MALVVRFPTSLNVRGHITSAKQKCRSLKQCTSIRGMPYKIHTHRGTMVDRFSQQQACRVTKSIWCVLIV